MTTRPSSNARAQEWHTRLPATLMQPRPVPRHQDPHHDITPASTMRKQERCGSYCGTTCRRHHCPKGAQTCDVSHTHRPWSIKDAVCKETRQPQNQYSFWSFCHLHCCGIAQPLVAAQIYSVSAQPRGCWHEALHHPLPTQIQGIEK
jgi:hypothetical protein